MNCAASSSSSSPSSSSLLLCYCLGLACVVAYPVWYLLPSSSAFRGLLRTIQKPYRRWSRRLAKHDRQQSQRDLRRKRRDRNELASRKRNSVSQAVEAERRANLEANVAGNAAYLASGFAPALVPRGAAAPRFQVAVDLSFLPHQTLRERHSVIKQLANIYGHMKRLPPEDLLALHVTSFAGPEVLHVAAKQGVSSWMIHRHTSSIENVFPSDRIVYLTPDSPNVLEDIDADKFYVIGGIVDRSVRKRESFEVAQMLHVETARLPLREFCKCRKYVLNIDVVIQCLIAFRKHGDWRPTFLEVIPSRFVAEHINVNKAEE